MYEQLKADYEAVVNACEDPKRLDELRVVMLGKRGLFKCLEVAGTNRAWPKEKVQDLEERFNRLVYDR